jgi:uncharacterized protein (TIGR01777 family)
MKVLITGGTGLIGTHLQEKLKNYDIEFHVLTRSPRLGHEFFWDHTTKQLDEASLKGITHVVNLAGQSIGANRWNEQIKKELTDSRVEGTTFLIEQLKKHNIKLASYVGASAIGFYGHDKGSFDETGPAGNDLLADMCVQWEQAHEPAKELATHFSILRIGMVFSPNGGIYEQMAAPIRNRIGAALGSGKQFVCWIHHQDVTNIIKLSLTESLGTVNLTAPNPVNNYVLTKAIGKHLKRAIWLPNVPSFVLKIMLGEFGSYVTKGPKVLPMSLIHRGYKFKFLDIETALANLQ